MASNDRSSCEAGNDLRKGRWSPAEDKMLREYVRKYGSSDWSSITKKTNLKRCPKSCRVRWITHLSPNLKRGRFSTEEEKTIVELQALHGNRWSRISYALPGRTGNEIKNFWNTRKRKLDKRAEFESSPQLQQQDQNPSSISLSSSSSVSMFPLSPITPSVPFAGCDYPFTLSTLLKTSLLKNFLNHPSLKFQSNYKTSNGQRQNLPFYLDESNSSDVLGHKGSFSLVQPSFVVPPGDNSNIIQPNVHNAIMNNNLPLMQTSYEYQVIAPCDSYNSSLLDTVVQQDNHNLRSGQFQYGNSISSENGAIDRKGKVVIETNAIGENTNNKKNDINYCQLPQGESEAIKERWDVMSAPDDDLLSLLDNFFAAPLSTDALNSSSIDGGSATPFSGAGGSRSPTHLNGQFFSNIGDN